MWPGRVKRDWLTMIDHQHQRFGWPLLVGLLFVTGGCEQGEVTAPASPAPREVEVVQVTAADVPVTSEFVGRTASSQRVEIRARVNGYLEEIAYKEGEFVEAGDLLFRIDALPFEARLRAANAELAQQQARLDNAQALLARIKPLAELEAVAQKELDDAQGRVNEAAAAVEAASARVFESELDLGYTTITSPVTGQSSSASQREGAYVGLAAEALTYVAKLDPIWVEFSVSEAQALRNVSQRESGLVVFPEGMSFNVSIVLSDGTTHPHTGRLSFADASVSEQTGTFLVRAEIPNPERTLRPGQYVRAVLSGAYRPDAIIAPQRALRQGPRGDYVWVVSEAGLAEQRPVVTGPWIKNDWIIEQGLRDGDRLIVGGSTGLTAGAPVTIVSISRPSGSSPGMGG